MMRLCVMVLSVLLLSHVVSLSCGAAEPKTLLQRIGEWQYPGSTFSGATMSDAETVNRNGVRTIPSLQCMTNMTTPDAYSKVVDYYKSMLKPTPAPDNVIAAEDETANTGRSVTFHDDSEGRPVKIQIIAVNDEKTSTTLVISRSSDEKETHIAWTQYGKL